MTAVRSGRLAEKARRSSLGPVAFALASQRMENRSRKSYFKRSITCCNTQAEFENFHEALSAFHEARQDPMLVEVNRKRWEDPTGDISGPDLMRDE